ncbi:MAG: hypothetical protein Kow0090_13410 [Myxococcota bacterium]
MKSILITGVIFMLAALISLTAYSQEEKKGEGAIKSWTEYQERYAFTCMGPLEFLPKPEKVKANERTLRIEGYRAVVENQKSDGKAIIGVISTIKDGEATTIYNIKEFVKAWQKEGVEAVIVGGDIGNTREATEMLLYTIAKPGWAVYVIMGNNDSRGNFHRAMQTLNKKFPQIINLNLIRRIDEEDFDIISLPGYYDKRFIRSGASCLYKREHIEELDDLVKESNSPIIFVSHGPPKDKGKEGIDFAFEAGNVGDNLLNPFIERNKIPFGIFGHIGEAGGKATDMKGNLVKEGALAERLYLNPGPGSSYPWQMNDGKIANGMAAILYLQGKKAKYKILKIPENAYEGKDLDEWTNLEEFKELDELRKEK